MDGPGFLGTGWAFPPLFDPRGKQARLVEASRDIAESLRILLSTRPGQRLMQPTYGCSLDMAVFALVDESLLTELRDAIERAVLFFEPRVTLDAVHFDTARMPDGVLQVHLAYTVRDTNSRSNLVFPLYTREGTDVGHRA